MSRFIHLRAHSAYSLLRGAIKIPDLVATAKRHGMPALALTDHDNLFGSLEFSQACLKEGIQPIIGYTASLVPWLSEKHADASRKAPESLLLYAKDAVGYQNLLKLASYAYTQPAEGNAPFLTYDMVCEHHEGLLVLTGGLQGGIGLMFANGRAHDAEVLLERLHGVFGDRLYIEINRHRLQDEKRIERSLIDLAIKFNAPLVASNQIYFATNDMFEAHDALRCVAEGRYVSEENREHLNQEFRFKSPQEMQLLFSDLPEAIANTEHFAKRCAIWSPARSPILPGFHMLDENGAVLSESDALRVQARVGLQKRLEVHVFTAEMDDAAREALAQPYRDRLEYELDVIITMKFPGYFLIVSDFITWAKQQDIPVGPGRGSGAGSLVAWSLLITDLDPLKFGLIFERFLNPERVSMPDFDIDFCQNRRDEVIRYVQQKYGDDRVAQIITFGKLQARAVLRDVGRVLQLPYTQVDRICKLVPNNPANPVTLEQAIALEPMLKNAIAEDENIAKLAALSLKLEGLYRHASTHAAGVVIADRPLMELVPLYRDPKSDMLVVQYSMKYAEEAGLVKFDFLGLKTLTVLQQAVVMLAARSIEVDLLKIPEGDTKTYALLTLGDTLGVFQFESAGMQDALRKLRPDCLEDLIALGALYRPGPMDNIPMYIARKHGREKVDTLHPLLGDVLKETYGVIIYQEQVQKIAQVLAGYTLGSADLLRRAMGKKIKAEMDAQRAIFVEGAKKNGVQEEQASNIFELVAKFAGYGFNKSHAAAYAVIAYQTAYIKANYPVEFIAASMNFEMNATDKLAQFKQEANKLGIAILPPDINASQVEFSVETQENQVLAVRYALSAIKNVGAQAMQAIVTEREAHGAFTSIHDLMQRVDVHVLNRRQMEHLIMAGCFDSLHANRRQLFDSLESLMHVANSATQDRHSSQSSLFSVGEALVQTRQELKAISDWPSVERLQKEFTAIGFYLSEHPLSAYQAPLKQLAITPACDLAKRLGSKYQPIKLAGVVMGIKFKVSAKGRFAFLLLSDASETYEVSIFDENLLNQHHAMLKEGELLYLEADGKADDGGLRIIVQRLQRLTEKLVDARYKHMSCYLQNSHSLPSVQAILGESVREGTQLDFRVTVPGGIVVIRARSRYQVTPQMLQQMQAVQGIRVEAA
jgi:DNA polymerase-3 subunit alpha